MEPAAEAGRGQEVARALKELAAKAPGEAPYRMALVEVLERLQDKPALGDAYRGLGQVLEKQGDRAGALEAYRRLQTLDPRARDAAEKVASLSPPRPAPPAKAPPPPATVELDPGLIALSEGEEAPAEEPGTVTLDEQATDDAAAYVARLEKELGGATGEVAFDLTDAAQEDALDAGAIAHEAEQVLGEMGGAGEARPAEGVLELLEDSSDLAAEAGAPDAPESLGLDVGEGVSPVASALAEAEDSQVSDHVAKGEVYLKYGLVDKAIEHLQQALTLSPRNLKARQRLKDVYLDRNLADQAVKEGLSISSILMSRGAKAEAKVELESLAKLDPSNALVREALEDLAGKAARPAARPTPPRPAAAPPAPAKAPPRKQVAAELAEVDSFLQQGMVEEARDALERILAAAPGNAEAQRRLEALEALPAAASASEGIVPGVGTFVGGQPMETAGELGGEPAPPEPPGEVSTEEPARPFSFLPSSEDVSAVFTVAQEEGPGEEGYVNFGTDLIEEIGVESPGDTAPLLTEILQEFRKGVREQLSPEDYETHYNLGIAYKEMELYDEAVEEFRLAAKEPGRVLVCANLLGLCFLAKGDAAQAVAELEQGLALPGVQGEEAWALQYDLATAYEATGDPAKAYELLSALQEEAPRFRDVKARLRDLKGRLKEPPPGRVRPAAGPAVRPREAPAPPPPAPAADPPQPPPQPGKSKKKKISFI
jgi:tetratricopeptide (TPR) repeat protein